MVTLYKNRSNVLLPDREIPVWSGYLYLTIRIISTGRFLFGTVPSANVSHRNMLIAVNVTPGFFFVAAPGRGL